MALQADKRLNLKLTPEVDSMLREIARRTGLKLVTIIAQGIEHQYREWKMAGWGAAREEGKKGTVL